jgi:hypothetical protein
MLQILKGSIKAGKGGQTDEGDKEEAENKVQQL